MSDKPFKMQGHTLPGPSQRSALKEKKQLTSDEGYEGGEGYNAIQEAQNTQPYVDTGADDAFAGDDTKKKKVDVEVTVNGEPV